MSAEAPVVVVRELERKNFIGGAAVVAAHISAPGRPLRFHLGGGSRQHRRAGAPGTGDQGIGDGLSSDPSRPTTFKKRYVVENQKLFRVSRLEEHNLDAAVEDQVIAQLERLAPGANGIVVSDFVYGVVTPAFWRLCSTWPSSTTCCSSGICNAAAKWDPSPALKASRCSAPMNGKPAWPCKTKTAAWSN